MPSPWLCTHGSPGGFPYGTRKVLILWLRFKYLRLILSLYDSKLSAVDSHAVVNVICGKWHSGEIW